MTRPKSMNLFLFVLFLTTSVQSQELYTPPHPSVETRWISPENPTGGKAAAGKANKGAKGSAFFTLKSGEQLVLMDVKGMGMIHRMWLSGTIPRSQEQQRLVRIDMYWDGSSTPAVSAPIGDFFGLGLGLSTSFKNALFSNPEGRSFNFTIPMPYKKGAKIVLTNESGSHALVWYDINYSTGQVPPDAMYFHAYWNRVKQTGIGKDFEILPAVNGKGRFIGTNIGVIGDSAYRGTWFGEGEVKIYLDGDTKLPSLSGTGTEDYIGSGWGQGEYQGDYQGSLVSDSKNDIYAFYRYHIPDPVYFHSNCRVTIQQIGNTTVENLREMVSKGVNLQPVWVFKKGDSDDIFNLQGKAPEQILLLDRPDIKGINDPMFNNGQFGANFYRSDDLSSVAYFYLDKPVSNLPPLANKQVRIEGLREKVWTKRK
ncbi:MAG TPA: glycoside hydrolase family 172 protein [Chitinophagaceae bacterium]|nr:glycoside hydrolase family 172 protein [Chitinophagaceae bacterium]